MPNQRMDFDLKIKTSADLQGLDKLKQSLKELKSFNIDDLLNLRGLNADKLLQNKKGELQALNTELFQIQHTVSQVDEAFNKAFDTRLGRTNLQALNKELNKIGINKIRQDFAKLGTTGNQAFIQLAHSATTTSLKLKESVTLVDKLGITLANTVRWQISTAILNKFVGSFQEAWGYSKKLDSSLNDIRIVTGKSADEMERFAEVANKAAQGLGAATTDYTKAALIYYQQGLSDEEAQARADVTIKAANVTGQSADTVSEQLTAVWNGYKVSAQETELYIDKLAAVAASTAADLEELSTGMSKVAAAANAMGVDIDQLNAQLATIVSATRQAPESVGTALKTVYARMSTISAGGIDEEDGATLTSYTEKMNKFGINVLDANNHLRDMGDVIEEIGGKWNTFNREQQVSLAQAMAGTRQYNNLLALFENFDKYQEALKTSQNSLGTLQKQQDIYMESTEAHLQQLSTATEGVFQSLIDNKDINKLIDGLTSIVKLVNQFVDAIGGGKSVLLGLSTILTTVFSKNIAQTISPVIQNMRDMRNSEIIKDDQIKATREWAQMLGLADQNVNELVNTKSKLTEYYSVMTNEEINAANAVMDNYAALLQEKEGLEGVAQAAKEITSKAVTQVDEEGKFVTPFKELQSIIDQLDFTKLNFGLEGFDNSFIEKIEVQLRTLQDQLQRTSSELSNLKDITNNDSESVLATRFNYVSTYIKSLRDKGIEVQDVLNKINEFAKKEHVNYVEGQSIPSVSYNPQVIQEFNEILEMARAAGDKGASTAGTLKEAIDDILSRWGKLNHAMAENREQLNFSQLEIRKNVQAFSQLTGSITGAVFGFNSLSNAMESISKNGVSGQAITGLIFGIRSLIKSITTAKSAISTLVKSMQTINLAQKFKNALDKESIKLQIAKIAGLKVEEVTEEKINAILAAKNTLLNLQNILILAAVAAIALAVYAYKDYTKTLEENAKRADEAAKKATEQREALEEEAGAIEELVSSYQSLANQYDQHEISLDELREKTYALCLSYGETDLALKAMIADYDELNKLMDESATNANQKVIDATQEEKRATNKNLDAQLYKAFGSRMDSTQGRWDIVEGIARNLRFDFPGAGYFYTKARNIKKNEIDLKGFGIRNTEEDKLEEALEKLANDENLIKGDKLNYNKFLKLIKENRSEVEDILLSNTSKAATQLRDKLNEVSEYLDAYEEATEKYKEYTKENIVLANKENINSFETFNNAVENMVKEALGQRVFEEDNKEEAYQWAINALAGISDAYNQYSQDATLALGFMSSHPDKSFEEITKEIDELSESEKLALLYLKDYIKEIKDIKNLPVLGDFLEKKSYNTKIQVALQDALDGQPLTKDKIRDILKGLDDKYILEIETKLDGKSAENQAYDLILESIKQQEALANDPTLRQKAIEEVEVEQNKYKTENQDAEFAWKGVDTGISSERVAGAEDALENIADLAKDKVPASKEEILNLAEALSEVNGDANKLSPTLQQLQKDLEDNEITTVKELKAIGDASLAYKKYTNVINDFTTTLQDLEKGTIDYAKAAENMSALHENANKQIDTLQKTYKTYKDVVKEYNKNQALSIDSLQSLVELGPEQLQYLIAEDGQLKLNKESIQQATIAQLEQAKATYIQAQAFQVKDIWENASSASDVEAWTNTYSLAKTEYDLTDAVIEGTVEIIKAKVATDAFAGSASRAEIAAENWARSMRGIAAQYDKTINLTKTNFGKAMDSSLAKRTKKNLDDEFDRYWDIKNAIEGVADALERVEDLQSHLHGKELIKSLENENALLEQQAGYYEQLADAQAREASELQAKLAAYGAIFDQSGQLLNYASLTASAVAAYNGGADEESYNEFKKLLERYDTLYYNEMKDTQDKLRKLRNQIIENNLKKWETEVSLKLDLKQAERDWNDFLKDINEDFTLTYKDLGSEFANIMKDLDTYMGNSGTLAATMKAIKDIEKEIDIMMAGGSSDKFFSVSDAQEKLKEYMKKLEDSAKDMKQLYEDAWDALLDGIDQAADKFDDLIEKFELIDNELEYQGQLISLLYGDEAYNLMNKLFTAQEINSMAQIKSLQQQKEMWAKMLSEVEEGTEEWQKYYENLNEAQSDLNNLVTEYIELLQKDYLNTVTDILSKLETAISGASLDDIALNWERIANNSKKYFDAVEGGFKIQSLANKIKESISETDDIKAQQKLQNLYDEEISYLREKDNLTQHDIDYAEAKYQITLKQIALEEAQANKTTMKMTRNSQGNWTYQYVADDEDVLNKQNDLNDAYAHLYDLAKSAYQENLDSLQSLQKEYLEKSAEYAELALTDKEKAVQLQAELDAWYFEQYQKLAEENVQYMDELEEARGLAFKFLTEQDMENARIENEYVLKEYEATAQKIADAWNADDGASVKSQILAAHNSITIASENYKRKVDEVAKTVKEDFGEKGIKGAIDAATASTQELQGETEKLRTQAEIELEIYRRYVEDCASAWDSAKNATVGALEEAQEYLKKVGDIATQAVSAIEAIAGAWKAAKGAKEDYGNTPAPGDTSGIPDFTIKDMQSGAFLNRDYKAATGGGTYLLTFDNGQSITITQAIFDAFIKLLEQSGWKGNGYDILTALLKNNGAIKGGSAGVNAMATMASGGYTGSWGDDGRLAVLHEKELVLNKDDTENLLNAINTIRGFGSNIESMVASKIMKLAAAISVPIVQGQVTNTSSTSSNNTYNITAEFPDVTSASEIEEALLSLNNYATQYVWNKQ